MVKEKILKLKVGEVWDEVTKKARPVFKTYFKKKSKEGKTYYACNDVIFVQEIEKKEKTSTQTSEGV